MHILKLSFHPRLTTSLDNIRNLLEKHIHRALAQGVSDHRPLDSNKVQHPFFTGLNPNWTIFKAKINIEPQLLQLLLLLLLLLLKLLFLVQKWAREGGLSGSPGPWS